MATLSFDPFYLHTWMHKPMEIIEALHLTEEQKQELRQLWNEEYPEQLKHADLESFSNYLNKVTPKKHYILKNQEEEIMGWVFLFERENESWFAMILSSRIQGKGLGTSLLRMMQAEEKKLIGWVIDHNRDRKCNGAVYKSPLAFYLKNHFRVVPEQRLETASISAVKIVWTRN